MSQKTFLMEVPRFIAQYDALDIDEARTYLKDELSKLADSKHVKVEDITGKAWPSSEEARVSRSKGEQVSKVNMITTCKNVTKATGSVFFLGPDRADVVMNGDVAKSLNLFDDSATDTDGFLSLGSYLSNLSLVGAKSVSEDTK